MDRNERIKAHEQNQRQLKRTEQARREEERKQRQARRQQRAMEENMMERKTTQKGATQRQNGTTEMKRSVESSVADKNKRILYTPEDAANQFQQARRTVEQKSKNLKIQTMPESQQRTVHANVPKRTTAETTKRKTQKKISFIAQISDVFQKMQKTQMQKKKLQRQQEKQNATIVTRTPRVTRETNGGRAISSSVGTSATKGRSQTPPVNWKKVSTIAGAAMVLTVGIIFIGAIGSGAEGTDAQNKNPIRDWINLVNFGNGGKDDKESGQSNEGTPNQGGNSGDVVTGITGNYSMDTAGGITVDISRIICPDWIDRQYLTVNEQSRPGKNMDSIQYIAIHYVGNPKTTAQNNRDYFESLKNQTSESKSSHFVVGLDGEVIQCIPLNEKSYATNERNVDTISIEVCHPDEGGQFNEQTYASVIKLTAWLCQQFALTEDNVIRHHDVTGKNCPKYYVEHEDAWIQMKADITAYMGANPNIQ